MPHILQPTETVKAAIERQLIAAQQAADAYVAEQAAEYGAQWAAKYGGDAEFDFDFLDVTSGQLLHNPADCPFCRLRNLKRAYGRIMLKESPHGKTH